MTTPEFNAYIEAADEVNRIRQELENNSPEYQAAVKKMNSTWAAHVEAMKKESKEAV